MVFRFFVVIEKGHLFVGLLHGLHRVDSVLEFVCCRIIWICLDGDGFINKAVLMKYAHSMSLLTLQVTLSVLLTATGVLIAALDHVPCIGGEIRCRGWAFIS